MSLREKEQIRKIIDLALEESEAIDAAEGGLINKFSLRRQKVIHSMAHNIRMLVEESE